MGRSPKYALLIVFVIASLMIGLLFASRTTEVKKDLARTQVKVNLPQGWNRSNDENSGVLFEASRQGKFATDSASVVLIREPQAVVDPDDYTYRLIMGAYKTIPSLSYIKDYRTRENGLYLRDLEGTYTLSGKKAYLWQQIYIGKNVRVLTASYSWESDRQTVEEVMLKVKKAFALRP